MTQEMQDAEYGSSSRSHFQPFQYFQNLHILTCIKTLSLYLGFLHYLKTAIALQILNGLQSLTERVSEILIPKTGPPKIPFISIKKYNNAIVLRTKLQDIHSNKCSLCTLALSLNHQSWNWTSIRTFLGDILPPNQQLEKGVWPNIVISFATGLVRFPTSLAFGSGLGNLTRTGHIQRIYKGQNS